MMNATVEVNGSRAALQHNGYIPFAVRITPYLAFGVDNRITISVNPSMQTNARWYTGAGVFRSVQLLHLPGLHIAPDGIFGSTRSLDWRDGAAVLAHLQAAVEVYNATGQARLAEVVHALDPSRPVTNAICSYWNGTDDATAREIAAKILASGGGVLQNIQGDSVGDTDWERRSEAFTDGLDVVGYNYMEDKYEQDHALYPQRVILGTENYAKEIGVHWPLVEKLPYVLGDFTRPACDYIGEAGLGKGCWSPPTPRSCWHCAWAQSRFRATRGGWPTTLTWTSSATGCRRATTAASCGAARPPRCSATTPPTSARSRC